MMYKEVYRYQFYVSIYDVTNYFSTMCVFPVGWEARGAGQGWTETSEGDFLKKKVFLRSDPLEVWEVTWRLFN